MQEHGKPTTTKFWNMRITATKYFFDAWAMHTGAEGQNET